MKKGLSFVLLIILIHYYKVVKGNCGTKNLIIGDDDSESEFSFGSYVPIMLYDISKSGIGYTANRNNAAVQCPSGTAYSSCLPSANEGGPNNRCGVYNRLC
ncbi:hypothetical protein Fmac_016641 [Flemingia macrophylla]|uniref:Uncharacterized protein n=1 Tax=Flemingia macrophylla TaxID=520843 RepID=A0ABD1MHX7_9FABA